MKTPSWLAVLLAVLWAMLIFLPALGTEPVLDDITLVVGNDTVHSLGNWRKWFTQDMWDIDLERAQRETRLQYYRPLLLATYALDWTWSGGNLLVFHLTNLVLHGLVTLLAIQLFRRWTPSTLIAVVAGLLFAVHPAKAENVAWVTGRPDILCGLGVVIALHGVARTFSSQRGGLPLQVLGTSIAFLSKEQAVVLPALVLVTIWFESDQPTRLLEVVRLFRARLPMILAYVGVSLLYLAARRTFLPLRPWKFSGLNGFDHFQFFLETVGRQVSSLLYPDNLSMSAATITHGSEGLHHPVVPMMVGAATLVTIPLLVIWLRRRNAAAAIGLGLFLSLLLPTSNIVLSGASSLTSPRFLYLPSFALSLILLGKNKAWPKPLFAVLIVFVAGLSARTWVRSEAFSSPEAFLDYEFRLNPSEPSNVIGMAQRDIREGEFSRALYRSLCGHKYATTRYKHQGESGQFLLQAINLQLDHLPDSSEKKLNEFAQFFTTVLQGTSVATLGPPLEMRVPPESGAARILRASRTHLLFRRATIEARLGQFERARVSHQRAREGCEACDFILLNSPTLALQTQDYDLAERMWTAQGRLGASHVSGLTNRQRIQQARRYTQLASSVSPQEAANLLARRDTELELYGVALARLRPWAESTDESLPPSFYQSFGLLAARAGEAQVAKRALERGGASPSQIDALIQAEEKKLHPINYDSLPPTFEPGGCRLEVDGQKKTTPNQVGVVPSRH